MKPEAVKSFITKPFFTAVGAGAVGALIYGDGFNKSLSILGDSLVLPFPVGVGVIAAGGSLVGGAIKTFVLPAINGNGKYVDMESKLIEPVVSGVGTAALWYFSLDNTGSMTDDLVDLAKGFSFGSIGSVLADYSADLVDPYVLQYMV
jgi:hypothetical protein